MLIYIFLALLILIIIYAIVTYNSLAKLKIKVEESFSIMDIYLKKRWALIPNVVEIVKHYMKHEQELIKDLTKIRADSYDKMTMQNKGSLDDELAQGLTKVIAIAENYPDLKASENFLDLSNQIAKVEEDIANARKYYNATVRNYNNKIVMFPSRLIAKLFGFKQKEMFEATSTEREGVPVKI